MIDHTSWQIALRAKALTLAVCTTGSTSLSATATGYARQAGSFLTDGFYIGMEVTASGFGTGQNNGLSVITGVTALALDVTKSGGTAVEGAGAGKTLAVGLPSRVAWENQDFAPAPVPGTPYVEEQYIPGPGDVRTLGANATILAEPMYALTLYAISNQDISAASKYADALITLFAPTTAIAVGSETLHVRADVVPYRGQLRQTGNGWAMVMVTIPLRIHTLNAI